PSALDPAVAAGVVNFAFGSNPITVFFKSFAIRASMTWLGCSTPELAQSAFAFHSRATLGSFHSSQYLIVPGPACCTSAVTKLINVSFVPVPSQLRSAGGSHVPGRFFFETSLQGCGEEVLAPWGVV